MRWVDPAQLHVTLIFLGQVPEEGVPAIRAALDRPFTLPVFTLQAAGLGTFPPRGAPRVIWVGIGDGQASLVRLHEETAARLEPLGFLPDRRFTPHLTLGRVKEAFAPLPPGWRDAPADAGRSAVRAMTLFRSTLGPKGALHDALLRVPLS